MARPTAAPSRPADPATALPPGLGRRSPSRAAPPTPPWPVASFDVDGVAVETEAEVGGGRPRGPASRGGPTTALRSRSVRRSPGRTIPPRLALRCVHRLGGVPPMQLARGWPVALFGVDGVAVEIEAGIDGDRPGGPVGRGGPATAPQSGPTRRSPGRSPLGAAGFAVRSPAWRCVPMPLTRAWSVALFGVDGVAVEIEADIGGGRLGGSVGRGGAATAPRSKTVRRSAGRSRSARLELGCVDRSEGVFRMPLARAWSVALFGVGGVASEIEADVGGGRAGGPAGRGGAATARQSGPVRRPPGRFRSARQALGCVAPSGGVFRCR
jgi:hypothetical protein